MGWDGLDDVKKVQQEFKINKNLRNLKNEF
jgi:hypothetical protein